MSISADGFVARENGDEDFLPDEAWSEYLKLAKEFGHIIWGRKTYETVKSWGENYFKDVSNLPTIIISHDAKSPEDENITVCGSPEEALLAVEKMGFERAFISGGPTINSSFLSAGLIDEIILDYNPIIIHSGLRVFSEYISDVKLKVSSINQLDTGSVRLHYTVIK